MDSKTQFTWIIKNFKDNINEGGPGESLQSPSFNMTNFPDKIWYLYIEKNENNYRRFFLRSDESHEECSFNITTTLSILDYSNQPTLTLIKKDIEKIEAKWYWIGLISLADLWKRLVNNDLIVFFEMDVNSAFNAKNIKTENPEIVESAKKAVNFGSFSDVTLQVDGKQIRVHKNILLNESKIFCEIFTKDESLVEVKITGVRYEVFEEMLRYIYTGKVENLAELASDILKAAYLYQIEGLMMICEDFTVRNINSDNVFELLIVADECGARYLETACLSLIQHNFAQVQNFAKLEQLSKSLLLKIIARLTSITNGN